MRVCIKCLVKKELICFSKAKDTKDGYQYTCRQCQKEYREARKEHLIQQRKLYYAENREEIIKDRQAYRDNNPEKVKETTRKYNKKASKKKQAHNAKRRAQKLQATPAWADLEKIEEIYKNCPEGYHVDHIVPLVHPDVCGLHIEYNLQYLPAKENCRKGNRITLEQLNKRGESQ